MPLTFANDGDRVTHNAATLGQLTNATLMLWIFKTSNADRQGFLYHTGSAGAGEFYLEFQSTGTTIDVARERATQYALARSDSANFAFYGLNTWMFVAGCFDTTTTANNKLLVGNERRLAAEPSSYAIQRTGTGTANLTTADFYAGNSSATTRETKGDIFFYAVWNRVLSNAEIIIQQRHPHRTPGCVLHEFPGLYGMGIQPDLSIYKTHGTITGAVRSARRPPLNVWFPRPKQPILHVPAAPAGYAHSWGYVLG